MCVYDGNIRQVLGDLIFLLHFPAMNAEYFSKNVSTRNILTKEEIIAVFQTYHNSKTYIFPLQKRLPVLIKLMRCVPDVSSDTSVWSISKIDFKQSAYTISDFSILRHFKVFSLMNLVDDDFRPDILNMREVSKGLMAFSMSIKVFKKIFTHFLYFFSDKILMSYQPMLKIATTHYRFHELICPPLR
jgi:hypothetical protein